RADRPPGLRHGGRSPLLRRHPHALGAVRRPAGEVPPGGLAARCAEVSVRSSCPGRPPMARRINKAAEQVLLNALAVGATVESAARRAGIGESTAYRRLADPAFQARLKQAQLDAVLRLAAMLTGGSPSSIKRLFDLQHDASAPAGVQRAA